MAHASIDDYISACPDDVRPVLETIRQTIRRAVPGGDETIRYGIPTIALDGGSVVHFADWKSHISVYPIPSGDDALDRELGRIPRG